MNQNYYWNQVTNLDAMNADHMGLYRRVRVLTSKQNVTLFASVALSAGHAESDS